MWRPYKGLSKCPEACDFKKDFCCQVGKIRRVYPKLKAIAETADVPWQLLAAIWFRESFSVASPKTPGGPWQFDPLPSAKTVDGYLSRLGLDPKTKAEIKKKGVNDFEAGGILAACHLKEKTDWRLTAESKPDVVIDAIYGYNGRAYGKADRSPYVMNGYDLTHSSMRLVGTIPDGKGGRKRIDIADARPGAYTVYRQLKELFG